MKPDYDITFDVDNLRFRYRIAGIVLHNGKILLQQVKGLDYWFLPGGRCTLGESAADCLKREMDEELNSEAEIGRLVWVAENFFNMDSRSHHELSLFFLVTFPEHSPVLETEEINGVDEGGGDVIEVINRWHKLDKLSEIILVPPFLKAGLRNIPRTTEHIVNREK